jgi:hypothetical protein
MTLQRMTKLVCRLLFIVLTLQLSGITCIGEELVCLDSVHQENRLMKADGDKGPEPCRSIPHCPCHFSFTAGPPMVHELYSPIISSVIPSRRQTIKSIAYSIFQPPIAVL